LDVMPFQFYRKINKTERHYYYSKSSIKVNRLLFTGIKNGSSPYSHKNYI